MNPDTHRTLGAALLIVGLATPASAQRILDWPLRTGAGPEAVTLGVEAVFWNPGAITAGATRGQALVADQRTPDLIGIDGFAAAGAWRLDARTTVAAAYQRVSIDDIGETSTSPLPDAGVFTFSIREEQIAAGAAHQLGPAVAFGAGVRYDRSNETGVDSSTTSLGAGFVIRPAVFRTPVLGASILTHAGGVRYLLGLDAAALNTSTLHLRAGYGVRAGEGLATEHRIGLTADWRATVAVTGGVATADVGAERSWDPVVGASLRVSRYELGVLRESLANDFGAAYSFRLRFGFK